MWNLFVLSQKTHFFLKEPANQATGLSFILIFLVIVAFSSSRNSRMKEWCPEKTAVGELTRKDLRCSAAKLSSWQGVWGALKHTIGNHRNWATERPTLMRVASEFWSYLLIYLDFCEKLYYISLLNGGSVAPTTRAVQTIPWPSFLRLDHLSSSYEKPCARAIYIRSTFSLAGWMTTTHH